MIADGRHFDAACFGAVNSGVVRVLDGVRVVP